MSINSSNDEEPSTSKAVTINDKNLAKDQVPAERAREHADKFIASLDKNRKPGNQYDAYVRPITQLTERRHRRRSGMPAVDDGRAENEPSDECDGMRIATLAFFTMMALMGFLCTYLLVYVVEPMTRKEHEELLRQAKAAGYDV